MELFDGAFGSAPEVGCRWREEADPACAMLEITGRGEPGFDITVEVEYGAVTVSAPGFHESFENVDPEVFPPELLDLVRDLLSPRTRIRERLAGGRPYWWRLERWESGRWIFYPPDSRLFWNRFAPRSERIYSNTNLPSREPLPATEKPQTN